MTSCFNSPKGKDELFRKAGGHRVRLKNKRQLQNSRRKPQGVAGFSVRVQKKTHLANEQQSLVLFKIPKSNRYQ